MFDEFRKMRAKYGLKQGLAREFRLWQNRYLHPTTSTTIRKSLAHLGVANGDLVLVHSAFSKIGYVRGGTATFLSALREAVGEAGTIMMPSFPFNSPALEFARKGATFDVRSTPCRVGRLQEDFRLRQGTKRSVHPTHPYAASGPLADWLLADHYRQLNPLGPGTPLHRFVERGGKCLLVGVGLRNCSPFRIIEGPDAYPHQVFEPEPFVFQVVGEDGKAFEARTLVHSGALAPLRNNEVFRAPLLSRGKLKAGHIGLAACLAVDCSGLSEILADMLAKGLTPYSGPPK